MGASYALGMSQPASKKLILNAFIGLRHFAQGKPIPDEAVAALNKAILDIDPTCSIRVKPTARSLAAAGAGLFHEDLKTRWGFDTPALQKIAKSLYQLTNLLRDNYYTNDALMSAEGLQCFEEIEKTSGGKLGSPFKKGESATPDKNVYFGTPLAVSNFDFATMNPREASGLAIALDAKIAERLGRVVGPTLANQRIISRFLREQPKGQTIQALQEVYYEGMGAANFMFGAATLKAGGFTNATTAFLMWSQDVLHRVPDPTFSTIANKLTENLMSKYDAPTVAASLDQFAGIMRDIKLDVEGAMLIRAVAKRTDPKGNTALVRDANFAYDNLQISLFGTKGIVGSLPTLTDYEALFSYIGRSPVAFLREVQDVAGEPLRFAMGPQSPTKSPQRTPADQPRA